MARVGSDRQLGRRMGAGAWAIFAACLLLAGESTADWEVYVGGGLGISALEEWTNGQASGQALGGQDVDSSPLLDATVGLAIPMDEIVPREWLASTRLPDWPVRIELEVAGLREHELKSFAAGEDYYTEIETITSFFNTWVDIPLVTMWRPVQYLGGLGRQPRVRQWLEPGRFFFGVGIGLSSIDLSGTSNVLSGRGDFIEFAWNAGGGIDYALTDHVDLSIGYRFVCLAGEKCMVHSDALEVDIRGGTPSAGDFDLKYELMAHELRVQVRVEVFDFLSPWR